MQLGTRTLVELATWKNITSGIDEKQQWWDVQKDQSLSKRAAILTYTFLKYTLSLYTKVYLILGVCTKVYLQNLANLDADTKVYLE